jgi:hypothetical protein
VALLVVGRDVLELQDASLVRRCAGRVDKLVICRERVLHWTSLDTQLPSDGARWGVETLTVAGLLGG